MATELDIRRLFMKMEQVSASDLHVKVGSAPVVRIASELREIDAEPLTAEDTKAILKPIIPDHLQQKLEDEGGLDFSHMEGANARFRCSIFYAGGDIHAAIRRVNPEIPGFKQLHLPDVYQHVAHTAHEGLVVVCGVTGRRRYSTGSSTVTMLQRRVWLM